MTPYTAFSELYDRCMDNVPYDRWAEAIVRILRDAEISGGSLVAELGCGTGEMTTRLRDAGYDMIGIDASEEMLAIAQEKEYERIDALRGDETEGFEEADPENEPCFPTIRFLHQDIRQMELYGTVAAMVSVCDTMNYLTAEKDLVSVFRLANNYLDKGGLFLFDLKTEYYYRTILGNCTRMEDYDDAVLVWDNEYDGESRTNEYNIMMFAKDGESGLYERHDEVHVQRAYSVEEIKRLLEAAGMSFVSACEAYTGDAVTETTERVLIIARENYQNNKYYG